MRASNATPRRLVRSGAPLVCRRHVDFCRTSSAICPSADA
ncbi:putative leader peptide [Streptomyces sp. SBC-4]|nr:putative leader peptide [Streptomyces sp. SBC-4]MDV5142947.1 putative leader peptide [Streptomyces sp. SBC-4]